jgi:hypothetical protein
MTMKPHYALLASAFLAAAALNACSKPASTDANTATADNSGANTADNSMTAADNTTSNAAQ